MRSFTRHTHELNADEVIALIGSVIKLEIECVPTTFDDASSEQCVHVHGGLLTGLHEDIQVATIQNADGPSTERKAVIVFEFDGKQVGVDGPARLTLTQMEPEN